jgi:hypothetical protein
VCKRAIVRLAHQAEVGTNGVIENTRYATRCPPIIADKIANTRNDPIAVRVEFNIGRTEPGSPRGEFRR